MRNFCRSCKVGSSSWLRYVWIGVGELFLNKGSSNDSNLLHHQLIRRRETSWPPSVIVGIFVALSVDYEKDLALGNEILR